MCAYKDAQRNIILGLMIIVCPRCGILYGVDPDEFAAVSRSVRCSNCDREWLQTPAAALPDNDDALRLLAASFGRDGPRPAPAPPAAPVRAEAASIVRPSPREKAEARPARPRSLPVEPEPPPRPAPVTALYPAAPATAAADELLPRGARLSSKQLDVLLNGVDDEAAGASPSDVGLIDPEPEPGKEDASRRSEVIASSPLLREAPKSESVRAFEPARAPSTAEDEVTAPPPPAEDAAESESPLRRFRVLRRQGTIVLAAGAVAVTLLVSVGLLAASRGLVMAAFPGSAGFYSAVGLAPSDSFAEGLEIRGVSSTRSWADGEQILTVAGDLANVAKQPRNLPMVRVVLVDGSDAEIQEVVVLPPGENLPVGESVRFEARISNPADTAERIKVSLAPRPEPS